MIRSARLPHFRSGLCRSTTKVRRRSINLPPVEFSVQRLTGINARLFAIQKSNDDDDEDDVQYAETDRAIEKAISLISAQAITLHDGVKCITSLAKSQTQDMLCRICTTLWKCSVRTSRESTHSAVSIADFLVHSSSRSQVDFEHQQGHSIRSPILISGDWRNTNRLWQDMPGIWELIGRMSEIPPALPRTHESQDNYFFSLLFLSHQPAFIGLGSYFAGTLQSAARPPLHPDDCEKWAMAVQTALELVHTTGPMLKKTVLDNHSNQRLLNLGQWCRWQKNLYNIAADDLIDSEYRALAIQLADRMTIEKHLTNNRWRRWQRELSEIIGEPRQEPYDRVRAKCISVQLASENEAMEAAATRRLPHLPPLSWRLLPPP